MGGEAPLNYVDYGTEGGDVGNEYYTEDYGDEYGNYGDEYGNYGDEYGNYGDEYGNYGDEYGTATAPAIPNKIK